MKRETRLNDIEKNQKKIVFKYDCSSKLELSRLYEEIRLNQINQNQRVR